MRRSRSLSTTALRKQSRSTPSRGPGNGTSSTMGSGRASGSAPQVISPDALPRTSAVAPDWSLYSTSTTSAPNSRAAPTTAASTTLRALSVLRAWVANANSCHASRSVRARTRPAYPWWSSHTAGGTTARRNGLTSATAKSPNAAMTLPANGTAFMPIPSANTSRTGIDRAKPTAKLVSPSAAMLYVAAARMSAAAPETLSGSGFAPTVAVSTRHAAEVAMTAAATLNVALTRLTRSAKTHAVPTAVANTTHGKSSSTRPYTRAASPQSIAVVLLPIRSCRLAMRLRMTRATIDATIHHVGGESVKAAPRAHTTQAIPATLTLTIRVLRRRGSERVATR